MSADELLALLTPVQRKILAADWSDASRVRSLKRTDADPLVDLGWMLRVPYENPRDELIYRYYALYRISRRGMALHGPCVELLAAIAHKPAESRILMSQQDWDDLQAWASDQGGP